MSRQYNDSLEDSFEYGGERCWLVRPRTREEWLNALEVRDKIKEEWSMLIHDEDDSELSSLLQLQEEYINEYRDSLADFHNGALSMNIAFLLKKNGLRIGDLENVLSLSPGYISRTAKENSGKKLSIDVVWKLAKLFEISVDKLIGDDISQLNGNMGLLFSFMDKLQEQTESADIEWFGFQGVHGKEGLLNIEALKEHFVENEDGSIGYQVPGWNQSVEFILADDVIGTYDVHDGKMLAIVPFRPRVNPAMLRDHYDFIFVNREGDGIERVFNSGDYPLEALDGRAGNLYWVAKKHIMDVPITADMRKFIIGYLEKAGE